jgi:hypothetical protein
LGNEAINTKNYNYWLIICFVVLFQLLITNYGLCQPSDDTVYVWFGSLDNSPVRVFPGQLYELDTWIICTPDAYVGSIVMTLGTKDQYVTQNLSSEYGWFGYPFTEWDDASFLQGWGGSPPNPPGWHGKAFAGWADLGVPPDPNPWLHFETPTKIITWVLEIADSNSFIGDTVECLRIGMDMMTYWQADDTLGYPLPLIPFFSLFYFTEPHDSCDYIPGDINGDDNVMGNDVTYGVRYFKGLGTSPPDSCYNTYTDDWLYSAGDVNGNCGFTGSDITYLVAYFKGINPEILWCEWTPPIGG